VAAPVQRPPAGRPVPVAADTRVLLPCPRRTLTVRTPTVRTPVRGSGSSSRAARRARCPVPQPVGVHRRRCPAARPAPAETAADPQPPLRRDGRAAHVGLARLRWSPGPGRHVAGGYRLSARADTRGGLPDTGRPHVPGPADTRDRRRAGGRCGSGHAGRPAAEASTGVAGVRPERDCAVRHWPAPRRPDR
jgi:hypothetical protein